MAIVKFSRSEGHPQIEIKAIGTTEEAFLQEFIDTNRGSRWQPKLHYDVDGNRAIRFNWITRVSLSNDVIPIKYLKNMHYLDKNVNYSAYKEKTFVPLIQELCTIYHIKWHVISNMVAYSHYEEMNYLAAIILCKDTRYAYVLRQKPDDGSMLEFSAYDNMTINKLKELERRLGI